MLKEDMAGAILENSGFQKSRSWIIEYRNEVMNLTEVNLCYICSRDLMDSRYWTLMRRRANSIVEDFRLCEECFEQYLRIMIYKAKVAQEI